MAHEEDPMGLYHHWHRLLRWRLVIPESLENFISASRMRSQRLCCAAASPRWTHILTWIQGSFNLVCWDDRVGEHFEDIVGLRLPRWYEMFKTPRNLAYGRISTQSNWLQGKVCACSLALLLMRLQAFLDYPIIGPNGARARVEVEASKSGVAKYEWEYDFIRVTLEGDSPRQFVLRDLRVQLPDNTDKEWA
jgi:hypothetical protein